MSDTHFKVQVKSDHIKKIIGAAPIQALAELIWNAVDADSNRVDIEIERTDLGMQSISIRDNGHGIPREDVEKLFGSLGGSWKAHGNKSKLEGRILHGKEGKGRFKALALGRVVDWEIRYKEGNKLYQYVVTILRDDLTDVRVSDVVEVAAELGAGVEVKITELERTFRSLEPENSVQSLSEIFALYLTDYSKVGIYVEYEKLDPATAIESRVSLELNSIADGDESFAASLELIEWKSASERWVFLCGLEGFPFQRLTPKFHSPGYQFSAYLKSAYISRLQAKGTLDLAEMDPLLVAAYDEAVEKIKEHFKAKVVEAAQSQIDQWKSEKIYPYRHEPSNSVEQAERQVFEIVALNVNKHLDNFDEQTKRTKTFQLRMLRQAIERGPDELQHILTEVLDLPERTQKEMSKLLEEANLANVISASKLVADRLKFIHGLEALLFSKESKNLLKERSQLHRIIADENTWIFGEEFNLAVDDQSLTEVLRAHQSSIGKEVRIDKPVLRVDGKRGIVDLMLSKSIPQSRATEREHLVVELKRPSVKIGADELTQVQKYAFTIAADERFAHLDTRWSFWAISNDLDAYARSQTRQQNRPRGLAFKSDDGKIEVWVKTWSEVIEECKSRMQFVQDTLNANVDRESSLKYLKSTYEKYLVGVAEEVSAEEPAEVAEPEPAE
ncbi:hypothetical protein IWQ54_002265 [Labrenzia sp. EL_195]|nr:hypothetical protein [Labrenzia sp. EL_195]